VASLTDALIDTMALVRYLEGELPKGADQVFRDAEAGKGRLHVPEIALAEFIYIALRGRLRAANPRAVVEEVLDQVHASEYLVVSSLPPTAWNRFLELDIRELHDRMIAAFALDRGLPLITNDPSFGSVPGLRTLWR
jgi:predicted nucleic acid-binding protein